MDFSLEDVNVADHGREPWHDPVGKKMLLQENEWHAGNEMRKGPQTMSKRIHGRVRGKIIELDDDLGVSDGQEVEIRVKVVPSPKKWGDGLRRCAGVLANEWTAEDDRILEEIYQDRKRDTRREVPGTDHLGGVQGYPNAPDCRDCGDVCPAAAGTHEDKQRGVRNTTVELGST